MQKMETFIMRLTKREALILVRDMWDWISKNPFKTKKNWPGWNQFKKESLDDPYCACCFYVDYRAKRNDEASDCDRCPLVKLWPEGCIDFDSPYGRWIQARIKKNRKDFVKYARIIRNAAKKELEKINVKWLM